MRSAVREPVIPLPLSKYRELMDYKRQALERAKPQTYPKSPIERDAEVAVFVCERFGRMTLLAILDECQKAYGWRRTPSLSAVSRYFKRVREASSKQV